MAKQSIRECGKKILFVSVAGPAYKLRVSWYQLGHARSLVVEAEPPKPRQRWSRPTKRSEFEFKVDWCFLGGLIENGPE